MIINLEDSASITKTDSTGGTAVRNGGGSGRTGFAGDSAAGMVLRLEKSIEFMRSHLNRPLPVATLAAVAGVSSSHFFATFKQLTGCAPIEFFISLRMRRACELLDSTSLSIKEIAADLGYDDQFYFSRVFKSATQVPPTHYRALSMGTREHIKGNIMPVASQFHGSQRFRLALPIPVPVCAGLPSRPARPFFQWRRPNNF